jgi:hypothetical protein
MTLAYVHSPEPPFARRAGPIGVANIERDTGLSVDSFANLVVSAVDVQEAWLRPGMCWSVEQSEIGEPLWAGFVEEEELAYRAGSVRVPLKGPKVGLLSIEMAVRLPLQVSKGDAVKQALLQAQAQNRGVFPGIIEEGGPAGELDVRGETISNFIETVKEQAAGADWRERVEFDGTQLIFYLDFGALRHYTNLTIRPDDISDGVFTRKAFVASVTQMAQAPGFETRAAFSTAGRSQLSDQPPDGTNQPLTAQVIDLMASRDIGPAAARHVVEISERQGPNRMSDFTAHRHVELLQGVDEIDLVLDATRPTPRAILVGDVVTLEVPDWACGLGLHQAMHVRRITPDAQGGKRKILGALIF